MRDFVLCDIEKSKMKVIVILFCLYVTVFSQDIESMKNMPKYDSRYDYLDVDALFNSKRLVRNYVDCLINGQRCTPEGKALKRLLPEALRTKCIRCTERQKKTAVKIIKRLKIEYPEEWAKLSSKWDPTGDFTKYFEVFLANEQFNTIPANGNEVSISPVPTLTLRPVPTSPPSSETPVTVATPPPPLLLNRFNDDGEIMVGSPSSAITTPRTTRPNIRTAPTMRPIMPQRPTAIPWGSIGPETIPTRFTTRPTKELPLPYSTAITLIDQIGIKIIRTTELVTDILRNTVRAVVGR